MRSLGNGIRTFVGQLTITPFPSTNVTLTVGGSGTFAQGLQVTGNSTVGFAGAGIELSASGGTGTVLAYNRTGGAFIPLALQGLGVTVSAPPTGVALTVNGSNAASPLQINAAGVAQVAVFDSTNASGAYTSWTNAGSFCGYVGSAKALFSTNLADMGIASIAGQNLALGIVGTAPRILIQPGTSGISINGAGSGTALTINSQVGTGQNVDLFIPRAGSVVNSVQNGPNLSLQDSSTNTFTTFQHSGGQTEIWQFNGGWHQMLAFTSTGLMSLNTANISSSGTAGSASALPGNPISYLQVKINGTVRNIPFY